MTDTRFRDSEIESLLTRAPTDSKDLEGLEEFISALATETTQPRDTYHMGTTLAAISRATAPTARRGMRRLATLAAAGAILVAMSGVALAADGSAPGEPLYRLDRALEAVGIGDGGFDERVEEFNVLLDRGEEAEAYEFMAEVIAEAGADEAASQQNVRPANESPARGTGNRNDGEVPGESRSGNSPEAPGQGNSQSPSNGNAPFTPADETPPANPNGQDRGVGPDGETPNPGQDNPAPDNPAPDNPAPDNPAQDNPAQDNPAPDNPGPDTENPGQDTAGRDNPAQDSENPGAESDQGNTNPSSGNPGNGPDQSDPNPGGNTGQGQPGSNPPDSPGQGNTGQGSPNQSSG